MVAFKPLTKITTVPARAPAPAPAAAPKVALPKAPIKLGVSKPILLPSKTPGGFTSVLLAPTGLTVPATPTISPSQAVAIVGGANVGDASSQAWIDSTHSAAAAGDTSAYGDAHLLTLADATHTIAGFVAKWFGQAQADTLLPMAHLGS